MLFLERACLILGSGLLFVSLTLAPDVPVFAGGSSGTCEILTDGCDSGCKNNRFPNCTAACLETGACTGCGCSGVSAGCHCIK